MNKIKKIKKKVFIRAKKEDIRLARRCLHFKGFRCFNKDCKNKACPLNPVWEED